MHKATIIEAFHIINTKTIPIIHFAPRIPKANKYKQLIPKYRDRLLTNTYASQMQKANKIEATHTFNTEILNTNTQLYHTMKCHQAACASDIKSEPK